MEFRKELEQLINRNSLENGSNTPDYILSMYLTDCLLAFNTAIQQREQWLGTNVKRKNKLKEAESEK